MNSPLISVVIVNYNYGRYLADCIDSVLAQTYSNVEIIVVDDGSTDDSLTVLEAYKDRIKLVQQHNQGVSCARNLGIQTSEGAWVAFLDSDDLWMQKKLEEQSQFFQDSSVGMVFCGLDHIDESGSQLGYTQPASGGDLLPELVTFTSPSIGGSSTAVARLEVVRDLGGFDESLSTAADLDMWIRIGAHWKIEAVRAPLVKYRRHADSMSSDTYRFECDNCRVLTKAFANPTCSRVHHLRRRAFGRFYMILAGSHYRERHFVQAIRYASKALVYRPLEITHLLCLPVRVVRHQRSCDVATQGRSRCPIRVLHVTSLQKACYGIRELVDHCDRRIIEFIVVTLTSEGTFAAELRRRGVTVYCLDCTKRSQYLKAVRLLLGIIRKHGVDVVHTHLIEPTWIGLAAARVMTRPVIITRHHSDHLYRIESLFKRYAYHALERCTGWLADHIITPSKYGRSILLNREGVPAGKISVIPHGQDSRRFEEVRETNIARVKNELGMHSRRALVCVSRLHPEKGHIHLFEALSVLTVEFPALSLYLVGEGPYRARLEDSARKAGIGDVVKFLGWRDDALDILAAADVVVHSSLVEAFGLAVIEAMALGKPVVCTDVADVREILGSYGKIVPPADSDALVDALRSTLSNLEEANRLAGRGQAHILECMAASQMAQDHVEVYRSVVARRHRLQV